MWITVRMLSLTSNRNPTQLYLAYTVKGFISPVPGKSRGRDDLGVSLMEPLSDVIKDPPFIPDSLKLVVPASSLGPLLSRRQKGNSSRLPVHESPPPAGIEATQKSSGIF